MRKSPPYLVGFVIACALMTLGQSCGAPPAPDPGPAVDATPPRATACGLIGNSCEVVTGRQPASIVIADFDRDGDADLAIVNEGSANISVLLNAGAGNFTTADILPVGTLAQSIVGADFNGDGYDDLAVAAVAPLSGPGAIVFLNDTTAGFTLAADAPTGTVGDMITAADLHGRGVLDLIIANELSGDVSILAGRGDGTFDPPVNISCGNGPQAVATGDLDGDGDIDLAVANEPDAAVAILLNDGHGNFASPVLVPLARGPTWIHAADLNGDGHVDLVTANHGTLEDTDDTISILSNMGNAAFTVTNIPVGVNPVCVKAADLSGDGRPDLAVANSGFGAGNSGVAVLLNDGAGGFSSPAFFASGVALDSLSVGDLDGDGDADIAAADRLGNQVILLGNNGAGGFSAAR